MTPDDFSRFLSNINNQSLYVIDPNIPTSKYVALDLSVDNEDLSKVDVSNVESLGAYIDSEITTKNGLVAYGGYIERRAIYDRSSYFNSEEKEAVRNIHLGLDIWLSAGSTIYAPLAGVVHSFKNNLNFGDYGPTIILQHTIQNHTFHTLYGHLSLKSIQSLSVGQEFKQAEVIGALGSELVNGNYPPHLHLQIIRDMHSNFGDYPGVCSAKTLQFYKENCPDPNLLLKI